jgi:hypothetical protein
MEPTSVEDDVDSVSRTSTKNVRDYYFACLISGRPVEDVSDRLAPQAPKANNYGVLVHLFSDTNVLQARKASMPI